MKKIILLIALIFQFVNLFSQDLGKSNGNIGVSQSKGAELNCNDVTYYSEWRDVSCYSKIKYRLKAVDLWDNGTVNVWKIQFKNNYSKNVNIKFKLYVGSELRIDDIIGVNGGKYWGMDCAGGSGAELSQSLSLDYELEIEEVKEDIRGTPMEDVKGFECDGVSTATNYKKYYPKTSSTNNSNQPQTKAQQKADAINQLATATVDLVTYFANRKNALRNSLSQEDGQALLDIVNSENPTEFTQNIIQIFTDLGYTLRETERKDGYVIITLNNDVANINDFMLIFVRPASFDYYNSISFSCHRKQKLREQLAVLGDKLKGLELQGISASNRQKKIVDDEKKLNDKTKNAKSLIDNFEKNNSWNNTDRSVFSSAKSIAEAYEDENSLNNKSEAIRYYRKAASITLDELASPWKGDKKMRAYQQKELAKVYFKLAYLLDDDENNNGKEAILWYQKSSEADYSKSSSNINIARLYKSGLQGVEKDWNQAKNYYEIAAEEKSAQAMYMLGKIYRDGGFNLGQDESKSKKWFKKACKEDKKYCN